jgi:hypothetical protein
MEFCSIGNEPIRRGSYCHCRHYHPVFNIHITDRDWLT